MQLPFHWQFYLLQQSLLRDALSTLACLAAAPSHAAQPVAHKMLQSLFCLQAIKSGALRADLVIIAQVQQCFVNLESLRVVEGDLGRERLKQGLIKSDIAADLSKQHVGTFLGKV